MCLQIRDVFKDWIGALNWKFGAWKKILTSGYHRLYFKNLFFFPLCAGFHLLWIFWWYRSVWDLFQVLWGLKQKVCPTFLVCSFRWLICDPCDVLPSPLLQMVSRKLWVDMTFRKCCIYVLKNERTTILFIFWEWLRHILINTVLCLSVLGT